SWAKLSATTQTPLKLPNRRKPGMCDQGSRVEENRSTMSTGEVHARISVLLTPQEIERIRHFGKVRSFRAGEALFSVGDLGLGLCVILAGNVELSRMFESGAGKTFPIQGPGEVLGEMAQLAGQATLVNGRALSPVEALLIPPDQVRALLVAETELGDRILNAMMTRRATMV